MLVGGVLGAVLIPPFSDKQHKRKRYLLLGFLLAIPGLIGLTFATSLWLLFVSAFVLGFFLVSTSPDRDAVRRRDHPAHPGRHLQRPDPALRPGLGGFRLHHGSAQGADGSFTPALLLAIGLMGISLLVITRLKDPIFKA